MSNIPQNLKYTKTHEWVLVNADGTATVGITDYAQDLLGDIVFIQAPDVGSTMKAGQDCAVVESVKAASDIYAPIAGKVTASNDALATEPEIVNKEPFGTGWIFQLSIADKGDLDKLLTPKQYADHVASEAH
jgi:glycine cleavage system H protein